jgi:hypothetical protein
MEAQAQRKSNIISRREIEALIADGRSIVIVDNKVLKVDAWLPYHPGGDKAIRHMVGRDATDEVHRYVNCKRALSKHALISIEQLPLRYDPRTYQSLPNRPHCGAMDQFRATNTRRDF